MKHKAYSNCACALSQRRDRAAHINVAIATTPTDRLCRERPINVWPDSSASLTWKIASTARHFRSAVGERTSPVSARSGSSGRRTRSSLLRSADVCRYSERDCYRCTWLRPLVCLERPRRVSSVFSADRRFNTVESIECGDASRWWHGWGTVHKSTIEGIARRGTTACVRLKIGAVVAMATDVRFMPECATEHSSSCQSLKRWRHRLHVSDHGTADVRRRFVFVNILMFCYCQGTLMG